MSVTILASTSALVALSAGSPAQALTPDDLGLTPGYTETYDSTASEEKIAACMTALGFEYEPWIHKTKATVMDTADGSFLVSLEEIEGGENPNDEIVAGLSAAERISYQHALHGNENPLDAQGYPTGNDLIISDGSCADDTP